MTDPLPSEYFVYRRLHPFHWDSRRNRLETSAFRLRSHEATLFVYRADRQTPRSVLQLCLDRGFRVSAPDSLGHQDVFGTQERFRETSRELRDLAEILSIEECLAG